jgi:hypothetical protein
MSRWVILNTEIIPDGKQYSGFSFVISRAIIKRRLSDWLCKLTGNYILMWATQIVAFVVWNCARDTDMTVSCHCTTVGLAGYTRRTGKRRE